VLYLAAWEPPTNLSGLFPNLKLLFSSGAGVDQFDFSALPPRLPVVRMVEPGIIRGMVEYVTHAVLDLHRDMPAYRRAQQRREWQPLKVRAAAERRVGVLGLGSLGQAVLSQLVTFGFDCAGWSRSRHVGRGPHLQTADLLAALDSGQLSEAVLDVTEPEPLPAAHPLWAHERVRITPHIASMTRADTAARVVIDNLRRFARGETLLGLVDRTRGY